MIWNWYWNCDGDPLPSEVPTLPADTTALVLNWHWNCGDAAPVSPTGSGVTVCVGCNIAISIRIASPGDSGDVAQTIGANATSAAENAAAAVQNAAQAALLPPASPPPPAMPVPPVPTIPQAPSGSVLQAPSGSAPPAPSGSAPAPPAPTATSAPTGAASVPAATGVVAALPAAPDAADAAPRHGTLSPGAPNLSATAGPATDQRDGAAGAPRPRLQPRVSGLWDVRSIVPATPVLRTSSPTVDDQQTSRRGSAVPPRSRGLRPPPPPPIVPAAPTPIVLAPVSGGVHSASAFTTSALATGALGALLLIFFAYAAPGLQTARSRFAHVHPDPPG